jgi:hemerythrin-like domain-containing protein
MDFATQVSRTLDAEHRATLALLGRVEAAFVRAPRTGACKEPAIAALAAELRLLLEEHVDRHFGFEEDDLFPRLAAAGDATLGELLHEEHVAILEVAAEIAPLASAAAKGSIDDEGFLRLRRGALELVERLGSHIQKETMSLLPALDDILDENSDAELTMAYASG